MIEALPAWARLTAFVASFLIVWAVAYVFIAPFTRSRARARPYAALFAAGWCLYALWLWGPILITG
jgi:hypothetical protein